LKHALIAAGAIAGSFVLSGGALADSFQEHVSQCVEQFASTRFSASVMLECTAGGGKLSDCKVVENSLAGKGFDKAALCVAEKLPMGTRTGTVKVPLKFEAES